MTDVRTHVALLRGVNLGGNSRLSMPDLRDAVESLGHTDVVTYIQSGNVVFRAARPGEADEKIASELRTVVTERTGVDAAVIVLRGAELADVVRVNPFPDPPDPRLLHAVFLPVPPDDAGLTSVADAVGRAREKGSRDDARVVARVLYLSTPDGFARSVLRVELDRKGAKRTPMGSGTARNWATVAKLHSLVGR